MPHPGHGVAWQPAVLCGWEPELRVSEDVQQGLPDRAGGCKWAQPLGKLLGSSIKVKINMPGDSAIPLLGINPDANVFMCSERCFRECS